MMLQRLTCLATMAAVLSITAGFADAEPAAERPGNAQQAPLLTGMGAYHFPVSTRVTRAQRYFDQGMVLAFGFNHAESARSFREAQRLDPKCAMAYWGEALVLGPNINAPMDPQNVPLAWKALQAAQQRAGATTERERQYIHALSHRYRENPPEDRASLDRAFAQAMNKLANAYPEDYTAQSLCAEALMDTTPWDYWQPNGKPKKVTRRILRRLETTLSRMPNHPLANHLYIHAVESVHPEWAVACADRLRNLVPGAGHLVHMPSHIFIRVGRYADASDANERAISVDNNYVTQCHAQGLYPLAYMPHNRHFLWFSATLEGRRDVSLQAAHGIRKHVDEQMMRQPGFGTLQHFYVLPIYAQLRFGLWERLAQQPKPAADLKYPTGVWHYAQGMAALRRGKPDQASAHRRELSRLAHDPDLLEVTIWDNNTTQHILQVAEQVLEGEWHASKKSFDRAIEHLERAVALETSMAYEEPQLWYAPTRQQLGAVQLDAGRYFEAEESFRKDLEKYPGNGWSLFGLREALRKQDKQDVAEKLNARFRAAWRRADIELTRAAF